MRRHNYGCVIMTITAFISHACSLLAVGISFLLHFDWFNRVDDDKIKKKLERQKLAELPDPSWQGTLY